MNLWGLVSAASLLASTGLLARLLAGPRSLTRTPLTLLMAAFAVTNLGEAVARLSTPAGTGDLFPWIRVWWVGIALSSGTFLHFVLNFATARPLSARPWAVPLVYGVSGAVTPLVIATDAIVSGVADSRFGPAAALGAGYLPAAIAYESWFLFTLFALLQGYRRSGSAEFRRRSRFVISVLAGAVVLASGTEIFWPVVSGEPTGLGLGSMYILLISVVFSYSEVRLHFQDIPALTESTSPPSRFRLRSGLSYLFLARERDPAFTAFREFVAQIPGLVVSGIHPGKVQPRYRLEKTPILWVTTTPETERSVHPKGLEFELTQSVARFVRENPSVVVLFDDVDLFVHMNGFDAVARFLRRLNNLATGKGSTTIATVDPETLSDPQLALLRGLFDEVREFGPVISFLEPRIPEETGAVLLEGDPDAAFSIYESLATPERGILVTTKNPARLKRRLGVTAPVVWIGGPGEAVEGGEGPASIDLEAGKIAAGLLKDRPRPIVYVADLEQVRLLAPFPRLLEFVKGLIDQTALRDGLLLAHVIPKGMHARELAALRRRFDFVRSTG